MFCCTILYVHSSIAIILMGKKELVTLLNLSSWCLVMVERLFLGVPQGCLRFVIVVFPDHTHLLFFKYWGTLDNTEAGYEAWPSKTTCLLQMSGNIGQYRRDLRATLFHVCMQI